jgi:hypothetical protein
MTKRKAAAKPAATSTTTTTTPSSSTIAPPNLEPFVPAPSKLLPFLKTLPPNHVYLTSLDTTPPRIKRNAFLVPVCLNTLITLGLCCRLYYAVPTYFWLIVTIFGYDTRAKVDIDNAAMTDLIGTVAGRTTLLMLDHVVFNFIGAWPWQFLFGSKEGGYVGPATWRWTVGGFWEKEVVVRRSRRWNKSVFGEDPAKDKKSKKKAEKPNQPLSMDEVLTVKLKVNPAMEEQYLKATGFAMLDKDWDLDFAGMVNAFQLIKGNRLGIEDLENKAFMYNAKEKVWLMWTVHEKLAPMEAGEKDPVVECFREKLAAMGHEDLFYRWIELVQYESSVPGGMTEARQMKVLHEARKIFAEKGVDFDKFFNDVGGQAGMPGLEN